MSITARIICHLAIKNDFSAILEPTEGQRIGNQTRPIKLPRARVAVWREFIARADEKLTAFLKLDSAIRVAGLAIATRHKEHSNWLAFAFCEHYRVRSRQLTIR